MEDLAWRSVVHLCSLGAARSQAHLKGVMAFKSVALLAKRRAPVAPPALVGPGTAVTEALT